MIAANPKTSMELGHHLSGNKKIKQTSMHKIRNIDTQNRTDFRLTQNTLIVYKNKPIKTKYTVALFSPIYFCNKINKTKLGIALKNAHFLASSAVKLSVSAFFIEAGGSMRQRRV